MGWPRINPYLGGMCSHCNMAASPLTSVVQVALNFQMPSELSPITVLRDKGMRTLFISWVLLEENGIFLKANIEYVFLG